MGMDRTPSSFESDRKWCPACESYHPYLMSYHTSYCVECGGEVRLFSKEDWEAFSESLSARRPRSRGRVQKNSERKRRGSA